MNVLLFIGEPGWTARARIFAAAAHGLAARGHEVTVACPPAIVERIDTRVVAVVRIDPAINAAIGTFDFRRVAQERSLDVVFVHTAREQLMVGSALRLAKGGHVIRRVGIFEPRDDEPGLLSTRIAPARLVVSTNAESAKMINAGLPAPVVVPLGADLAAADAAQPIERRQLHLRDDAVIVACPYAPNGRARALTMMRVLALLAPRHQRIRAVVFGHRATDDDLRMQAAALGVAPLIQFADAAVLDPVAVMKTCDLAWVAADHDPAALGCLDAMSAARPIVAESSPTIDYFVADGINGTVLPEGDPAAVAAAVASIVSRADVRAGYGHAGRMRLERELDLSRMIDGFDRAVQSTRQTATR